LSLQDLVEQVRQARAAATPLTITGGGTKAFYGEAGEAGTDEARAQVMDTRVLAGIRSYEPSELVVTVGAGTPLAELEAALAEQGQCLAFEPPRFAAGGTVGGMVAAGLAGPARATAGSVRDHLLGATLLTGKAELLSFGGTVMKNVAGYDVSRVLAGSLGMLGVICEVSLKVLPVAAASVTLRMERPQAQALQALNEWGGQPLPLHASAWWDGVLVRRWSGAAAAVTAAQHKLGGEVVAADTAAQFWQGLRDHSDEFFAAAERAVRGGGMGLWRLSVPQTAPALGLAGEQLLEWGGGQRWLCTPRAASTVREAAAAAGGHATLFRGNDKSAGVFTLLSPPLLRIHRELKTAFDPDRVFNRGRLVPGL